VLTRALHLLPPERAHRLAILGLGQGFSGLGRRVDPGAWPRLATRLAGLDLPSPLGLAAGFDKNAEALPGLAKLGFGWLETGTITPRPQRGNPQPRLFRLAEDRALINRCARRTWARRTTARGCRASSPRASRSRCTAMRATRR
jgi:dihydroorotate dehydrogenase